MTDEEAKAHVRERIAIADAKGWDRNTFYTEALVKVGAPPGTEANVVMKMTAPLRALVR